MATATTATSAASKKTMPTPVVATDHAHYHHLIGAAAWSLPTLALAIVVLAGVDAGVQGLGALAAKAPAGPLRKLVAGLHAVVANAVGAKGGGGAKGGRDLKDVILTAILIGLLVVGNGVWNLVSLKATEMEKLLGERPEAVQRAAAAARPRRDPGSGSG